MDATSGTKEEMKQNTEEYLKELLGAAALDALKSRSQYLGLCKECANREVCRKRKRGEIIMSCASHKTGLAIQPRTFKSFDEVMDFAIEKEGTTAAIYLEMAKAVRDAASRKAFKTFAKRSVKRRKRLQKVKRDGRMTIAPQKVQTLKITKYVTREVSLNPNMDTRDAMMAAIRTATAAQNLYADLANQADDLNIQTLFAAFAQEEAELKLALETEYDDHVFAQD